MLSHNGWPASQDPDEIDVKSFPVPNTKLKLRCAGKVAPLLIGFASEFDKLVEPIDEGALDDWGYAYRNIRGDDATLSNHASGTAIDLNATAHKLGEVGTFNKKQAATIRTLAKKYGLRWGGDYAFRKDEMHVEVMLDQRAAARLVATLKEKKNEQTD